MSGVLVSYQEKRIAVTTFSGLLIFLCYYIYGYTKYIDVGVSLFDDLHFWVTAMLATIVIGIVAIIVIQIIFHIVLAVASEVSKEVSKKTGNNHDKASSDQFEIVEKEDEMDKLIALRATRILSTVVSLGFIVSLVALYFGMPTAVMLNIIFLSFAIGTLAEGFSQLYFYKNGIKND